MDLIDLVAEIVQRLQAVLNVAPAGESPVYVLPPGGTKEWLPYVQAVGALGTIAAVTVAVLIPTRIQRRALEHDREVRVNDDARRALGEVMRSAHTAHEQVSLLPVRFINARNAERSGRAADDVTTRFVRAMDGLRSSVAYAKLFFPPDSEMEDQMSNYEDAISIAAGAVLDMAQEGTLDDWEDGIAPFQTQISRRHASFVGRSQQFARGALSRDSPKLDSNIDWDAEVLEEHSPD